MTMEKNQNPTSSLIKPINKEVIHQICSGQVILTLAVAVKELVENSIDAGASIIDITLKEYGSESIEVCDNGKGVLPENFQALTLKHYTSKIDNFSDLQILETLGFRGEALSSLCALAELTILTKHASTEQANIIKYNKDGKIMEVSLAARQIGTTVKLENLFSTLPVRRKEFMKNLKREFNKMCQLLYSYCLVSKGIKFTCTNITASRKNVVVATQGHNKVRENIISVFGAKQISSLIEVDLVRPDEDILKEYGIKLGDDEELPFTMEFLISSVTHGHGRSSTDRQFFYVNSRPVEPTKIIKLINQIFRQFNFNQYPFVYINIMVKSSLVDINVTPDKRQIFLEQEKLFLAAIKASLLESFKLFPSQVRLENQDISKLLTFSNSKVDSQGIKRSLTDSPEKKEDLFNSFRKKYKSDTAIISEKDRTKSTSLHYVKDELVDQVQRDLHIFDVENQSRDKKFKDFHKSEEGSSSFEFKLCKLEKDRTKSNSPHYVKDELVDQVQRDVHIFDVENQSRDRKFKDFHKSEEGPSSFEFKLCKLDRDVKQKENIMKYLPEESSKDNRNVSFENSTSKMHNLTLSKFEDNNAVMKANSSIESLLSKDDVTVEKKQITEESEEVTIVLDTAAKKNKQKKRVQYDISLQSIRDSLAKRQTNKINSPDIKIKFRSTITPENNKKAEEELQKQLSKSDFFNMQILGQFNLGFIITRLGNDLFIIDQHASDEKYNFEQLQASTVLQKQVLVNPKTLELTAGNESILIENEEIFKRNGFHFKFDESAPIGKRVLLTAVPLSQNVVFGKDDIDEMLFMLKDSSHTMCRPSRVRDMFASRACRKSVMIGTALSMKDMKQQVEHMGEINQPWNCPHGRPTIRHLLNMDLLTKDDET